uniref:Dihydroflavonol 4-reductase n=1 Tax=Camellia sinensis TaxID=4442 RepID=A0A286QXW1_CAMSI|nr:dihydroflavonol-4-reductase [Camellia sinensis]
MEEEREHGGSGRTVCVTGASGFIGSWLVMTLLQRGYHVRATVRDPDNKSKVSHLLDLPKAGTHLTLWKADIMEEGSFDDPIHGCDGVFHVATPTEFSSKDPENEVIKPTVNGVLNIMRSCSKAKTVKRLIHTSTTGTVVIQPQPQPQPEPDQYDESFWTDINFCKAQKMTGWMYFVGKTMAEKAAWEFAEENGLDLITIQPSIVIGPFITPSKPLSIELSIALITRNERLYPMLTRARAVHVVDVCNAHIYLLEHPQAKGRYICSSHCFTIFDLSKSLSQKYPEFNIPTKFESVDESLKPIPASSKKLLDLGFKFKYNPDEYNAGDLCSEAIEFCREKGWLTL